MSTTTDKVEEAIENLDKPKDDKVEVPVKEDDKPVEVPVKEEPAPTDDEGFTAEELAGEEPKEEMDSFPQAEPTKATGLTPEQQYIYDNLPNINVRGADGRMYSVKVDTELPEEFDFASKSEERTFYRNLTAQELNARELQNSFLSSQQAQQAQDFDQKENAAIRQDWNELQKEGLLPKVKVKLDDPKLADDPAVKEMQEILDLMGERNEQYLKEWQQGRPYKHIGFREAFTMWQKTEATNQKQSAQRNEDRSRHELADKVTANQGLNSSELQKPVVRSGTSTRDILARIDALDI